MDKRDAPLKDLISTVLRTTLSGTGGEYELAHFEKSVIARFGSRSPFAQLFRDRQRRGTFLKAVCKRRRIALPVDMRRGMESPGSWREALESEAARLQANVLLYDRLLALPIDDRDIRALLAAFRKETGQIHLPLVSPRGAGR